MGKSKGITAVLSLKDKNFGVGLKNAGNNTGAFNKRLKYMNNQINRFAQNANQRFKLVTKSMVGLAAGYIGLSGGANLFGKAISGAADLEQYRNTLNVVMKDQKKAAETMAWAVDFANKTPFETDEIVQATVRLQSYGISAKETMTSIGDMAGVMGKDVMQAVEAIADAQAGELERLTFSLAA